MSEIVGIEPGQIWHENDKRMDRNVLVLSLSNGSAEIVTVTKIGGRWERAPRARNSWAQVHRFGKGTHGGYTFVEDLTTAHHKPRRS